MKKTPIPIVEIFDSIQGEGKRICPAVFVRSGLCCFTCKGFGCSLEAPDGTLVKGCDSIRAVSPKFRERWDFVENYQAFVSKISQKFNKVLISDGRRQDLVFTGGEPLLYWDNQTYQDTLAYFISRGHKVTIETNASLDIEFTKKYQDSIMFSMSVKLSHSGEPKERRINIETISKIMEHCPESYLKFVINPKTWESDILEIQEIHSQLPIYVDTYLMPLGENQVQLQENTNFVMERCVEFGFGYSDRAHIRSWNTKEAV